MKDMTILHEVTEERGQQLIGERIVRLNTGGWKLRARIVRDSYHVQSYANVSLLHETGWQHLAYMPMEALRIWQFRRSSDGWMDAMFDDLAVLITLGRTVIE